jgi:molecular chaperone GrpE
VSDEETQVTDGQAAEQVHEPPENEATDSTADSAVQDGTVSLAEHQKLQTQSQEYLDGWQRARAEFANYKKRVERDMKDSYQNAAGDVLKSLLPVIDDFDRALANVPPELQGNQWINGINLIQRKLNKMLDDYGVTPIDPTGEAFDPALHEAIGQDSDTDVPSGHITATMQKGYKVGERVLRPALVRVAS